MEVGPRHRKGHTPSHARRRVPAAVGGGRVSIRDAGTARDGTPNISARRISSAAMHGTSSRIALPDPARSRASAGRRAEIRKDVSTRVFRELQIRDGRLNTRPVPSPQA